MGSLALSGKKIFSTVTSPVKWMGLGGTAIMEEEDMISKSL
jgi:hypothetical protein